MPKLIEINRYGKNKPLVDTYISEDHAVKIKNKWLLPRNEKNMLSKWNSKMVTYYHIELPNYLTDNLVVNGLVMESWDGKQIGEKREYVWKKSGKLGRFTREIKY
jgi:hypothetical protein